MLTTLKSFKAAVLYLQQKGIPLELKEGEISYLTYGDTLYAFGEHIGVYLITSQNSFEIVEGDINKNFFIQKGIKASYGIEFV